MLRGHGDGEGGTLGDRGREEGCGVECVVDMKGRRERGSRDRRGRCPAGTLGNSDFKGDEESGSYPFSLNHPFPLVLHDTDSHPFLQVLQSQGRSAQIDENLALV